MRFSVFPCLSAKTLSDDSVSSNKTIVSTTATLVNEKSDSFTETSSPSDQNSAVSISDKSSTATVVNTAPRSSKTKMSINEITKVVVSPRPFAAGSDAVVYYCQVYYGPVSASITSISGSTTPTTTTTGSDHGNDAGVSDPVVSTSVVSLSADSLAVLKINRKEEADRSQRLTAPLFDSSLRSMATASIRSRAEHEIKILQRLVPQQGVGVPRLLGTLSSAATPKSHGLKLILENGGTTLNTLAYEQPYAYLLWSEDLNASARAALKACHALGVAHGGLHADNLVVHWVSDAAEQAHGKENDPLVSPVSPQSATGSSDFEKLSLSDFALKDDRKILTYAALSSRKGRTSYSYQYKPPGISVRVFIIDWSKAVTMPSAAKKQQELNDLNDILTTCNNYARKRD